MKIRVEGEPFPFEPRRRTRDAARTALPSCSCAKCSEAAEATRTADAALIVGDSAELIMSPAAMVREYRRRAEIGEIVPTGAILPVERDRQLRADVNGLCAVAGDQNASLVERARALGALQRAFWRGQEDSPNAA